MAGGVLAGRWLDTPRGSETRPTAGRTRRGLFDHLADKVIGAVALDLFAGSGSLGIEALSRGADMAVFVDRSRPAIRCLSTNLQRLSLLGRAQILCSTAHHAVQDFITGGRHFDLVLADPPYAQIGALTGLPLVQLLTQRGILAVEQSLRASSPAFPGARMVHQLHYGDACFSLFERVEMPEDGET